MRRAFLLFGLASLLCVSASAQQARRATPGTFARPDRTPVYIKWLNEDVTYIITEEERRAFRMLKSDEEREQFVEAFWRRRDLDPVTPLNEYREAHYRRVAYANEHFTNDHAAGWKTDRGRIYIKHGQPDEVLKTVRGETWVYKVLPGVGSNVEKMFLLNPATGDFQLQMR